MFKKFFDSFKKKKEESNQEIEDIKKEDEIEEEKAQKEVELDDMSKEKDEIVQEEVELESSSQENDTIIEEVFDSIENEKNIDDEKVEEISEEVDSEELDLEQDIKIIENDTIEDETIEETEEEKKVNLFERLKQGLNKAKQGITDKIDSVIKSYTKVGEELLEELEEILITSDIGVNTTMEIIEILRVKIKEKGIKDPQDVKLELKSIIEEILTDDNSKIDVSKSPTIILMVGVNGVGKTTTIGKLTKRFKNEGKKVLVAAGDTFRAAAIEQLEVWTKRSGVDIIKHQEGADPGAVIFDAIKAAKARNIDILICDTAGRLHNKSNLMNELGKVFKIVDREFPEAKKEVLLVVDATTGQNAVSQAKTFKEVCDITGIVLTKLDGTAKGGVVLAVKNEIDVPVKLIGIGEKVEDLQDFDAKNFSEALFG